MKEYKCVYDCDCGCEDGFGCGIVDTIVGWKGRALQWCIDQGDEEEINFVSETINDYKTDEEIIDFIQSYWNIEIVEV